jgi:Tol biopolymer transport system component
VVLLAVLAAGCADTELPTVPKYGHVILQVRTTGGDVDLNGYRATIDGRERLGQFYGDGFGEPLSVNPGAHAVTLDDVASNCTSSNGFSKSVTVDEGKFVVVPFDIVCVATGLAITTSTSGSDTPDSVQVLLSGRPYEMARTGRLQVSRLTPGGYTIALVAPENCTVSGGPPGAIVAVDAGRVVTVPSFQVDCAPAVRSPRIAYVSAYTADGTTRRWIETVKPDGSARARLTLGDTPAWSPGGTKLAFSTMSCRPHPWYEDAQICDVGIAIMDPETGNRSVLGPAVDGSRPAWSSFGDAIAFEHREFPDGPAQLMLTSPSDSSGLRISIDPDGPRSLEQPAWSPDGRRLAFTCSWSSRVDLCLANRDGTGLVRLTDDSLLDGDPAWSPDGRRIAFTRRGADASDLDRAEVNLLDLATGRITVLTAGSDPAWSPDGSKLAFAGGDGIFVVNADGTNRTRLTSGQHSAPAWRP